MATQSRTYAEVLALLATLADNEPALVRIRSRLRKLGAELPANPAPSPAPAPDAPKGAAKGASKPAPAPEPAPAPAKPKGAGIVKRKIALHKAGMAAIAAGTLTGPQFDAISRIARKDVDAAERALADAIASPEVAGALESGDVAPEFK